MNRCYILDYTLDCIYRVELPKDVNSNEEVESYLCTLGFDINSISYMTTNSELSIINL